MTVYPNVKLNLGLRVLGRRPDGYHELETLFVPCDAFHDRLEISPSESFSLKIVGSSYGNWPAEKDLVAKAWMLLRDEFGIAPVSVLLEKNSPVGAGLGGGSADAAFMIRALNDIFSLEQDDAALAALAARLGSDCPFFIYNSPMFATGRGEVLEPFALDLSGYRIEVAIPEGVAVSTAEAYAGLDAAQPASAPCHPRHRERGDRIAVGSSEARRSAGPAPSGAQPLPLREALTLPVTQWRDAVVNDFERSVFPPHPEIAALKAQMYTRGAVYAAMSGSGSAVFGLFPAA